MAHGQRFRRYQLGPSRPDYRRQHGIGGCTNHSTQCPARQSRPKTLSKD